MRWMLMVLAGAVAVAVPPRPTRTAAAEAGMLAAEWAFIRHCEREGIKAAFLAAFHPQGLLFRPEPHNGREWYGHQAESSARLVWFPALTYTAGSGDLGYNAGPWSWRAAADAPVSAHGWFFSVWKHSPEGGWQLFWDIGLSTRSAAQAEPLLPAAAVPGRTETPTAPLSEAQALELDRRFGARASLGEEAAYRTQLAPEGRLFRGPAQPAKGWTEAQALLAASPGRRTWEPRGALVARSGELLFVQGSYRRELSSGPAESGTYVRVWRRLGTTWTLELDLESPKTGS